MLVSSKVLDENILDFLLLAYILMFNIVLAFNTNVLFSIVSLSAN